MAGAAGKRTTQLDRIEAKLDALIEALAEEAGEEETIEVVTLDGESRRLPAADPMGTL